MTAFAIESGDDVDGLVSHTGDTAYAAAKWNGPPAASIGIASVGGRTDGLIVPVRGDDGTAVDLP